MKYRVDFHVHSDRSIDGRSPLPALAAAAKRRGLHAIAIADHDLFTVPAPVELDGVLLLPAVELTTAQGHLLGLLPEREPGLAALRKNGLPSLSQAAKELRRCGALAVPAHPFAHPPANLDFPGFVPDALETENARAPLHNAQANRKAALWARERGLPAVGGSDAHSGAEVGNAYTEVESEALTPAALREAIRAGRCAPVPVKRTAPLSKGLSQFQKARRSKHPRRICRGVAYLGYSLLRGIFFKR